MYRIRHNNTLFLLIFVIALAFVGCGSDSASGAKEFVVNKRTGKIHSPECSAVKRMSEKNKLVVLDICLLS